MYAQCTRMVGPPLFQGRDAPACRDVVLHCDRNDDRMSRPRRAFTLLELLLVLGLIGLAIAWVAPAWQGQLARQRLDSAAADLRSAWQEARLRAIEDGETYVFEVVPGTGHYRVRLAATLAAELAATRFDAADGDEAERIADRTVESTLPTDVVLLVARDEDQDAAKTELVAGAQAVPDTTAAALAAAVGAAGDEAQEDAVLPEAAEDTPGEQDWVPWAAFHPHGRTTDARVVLATPRAPHLREVTLRGLTGHVTIAKLYRPESFPK